MCIARVKPDKDMTWHSVDLAHLTDLVALFNILFVVDTNSVDPDAAVSSLLRQTTTSEILKELAQIPADGDRFAVDEDRSARSFRTPCA